MLVDLLSIVGLKSPYWSFVPFFNQPFVEEIVAGIEFGLVEEFLQMFEVAVLGDGVDAVHALPDFVVELCSRWSGRSGIDHLRCVESQFIGEYFQGNSSWMF